VAMNGGYGGQGVSNVVDVQGFNYNEPRSTNFTRILGQAVLGSETASTVSTRGITKTMRRRAMFAPTTRETEVGGDRRVLVEVLRRAPVPGGRLRLDRVRLPREPTPYGWPCINSHFGILDMCGFPRTTSTLPGVVGFQARAAPVSALELSGKRARRSRSGATPTWSRWSCF